MKSLLLASSALTLAAAAADAGGVGRSGQPVDVIFEDGNYARLTFGSVSPDVSGVQTIAVGPFGPGSPSGDMTGDYTQLSLSYKHQLTDRLAAALILDEPFGADVSYPEDEPYFARGSTAELDSRSLTGILKYRFPNNLSLYGGLRYQTFSAKGFIPFVTSGPGPGIVAPGAPYDAVGEEDESWGYLFGVAYEVPAIALRVALTYQSAIEHELDTSETSVLGASSSVTPVDTPQSVTLDFETGIAADTLLFGKIRWVDWTEFDITPQDYLALTGVSLVSYLDDTTTYSLGVGRRLTEKFAGAVSVSYEPENNNFATNLGPTDGNISLGVAGTYTHENVTLTAGVRYAWIGNARTRVNGVPATRFEDNEAVGIGVEVGYRF